MRPRLSTLPCLLILAACGGSAPIEPEVSAEIETIVLHTIAGRVTVLDERGLPEVTVELSDGAGADSTSTDQTGRYVFEDIPEGIYTLTIGGLPGNVFFKTNAETVTTAEGGELVEVDFDGIYVPVEITSPAPPARMHVGIPYSDTATAKGGDEDYTWSVVDGALPTGLELDAESGVIHGEPTAYGLWPLTVEVTSGDGQADRLELAFDLVLHPTARCSEHPDTAVATFEDPDLEALVGASYPLKPNEPLTCSALRNVTGLAATDRPISSLQGVQNVTNARFLMFRSTEISDLSPLADLTNLTTISLNLGRRDGGEAPLSDITPLRNLTNLTRLNLRENSIRDITPLRDLTALEYLDLSSNEISDPGPLSSLTALRELSLGSNRITDVTPLAELHNLWSLKLGRNEIHDINPLSGLVSLGSLDLIDNDIADIGPLAGLNHVGSLNLSANRIIDISPLATMAALAHLYLEDNPIEEIGMMSGMGGLRVLYLGNVHVADIAPVASLTHLTQLELGSNPHIMDFGPLTHLTELQSFSLRDNPLFTLDVLSAATKLKLVDVRNDDVENVGVLANFPELQVVALSNNPRVSDIQPLIDHPNIGARAHVWVDGTSVECGAVEALEAKGVRVRSDCAPWGE